MPEEVLIDNPRSLVTSHDAATRAVTFNATFLAFARYWRFRPRACAPYRARTKGKTESGVGYVKKNAIAGRSFASWEAFEAHLAEWEREVANRREHGTTEEAPRPLVSRGFQGDAETTASSRAPGAAGSRPMVEASRLKLPRAGSEVQRCNAHGAMRREALFF